MKTIKKIIRLIAVGLASIAFLPAVIVYGKNYYIIAIEIFNYELDKLLDGEA